MLGYLVTVLTLVAIAAAAGLALNLQWGLCGMVNFGVAGFYALGAYGCAIFALKLGFGSGLAMIAAVALVALVSAAVALVSIRLSEDYLAITTLGFAEVLHVATLNEDWLTRGSLGLPGVPRPFFETIGAEQYQVFFMAFAWLIVLGIFAMLEMLARAPIGRAFRAVREDEIVAATLGKNVLSLRVRAFAIGGAILGAAGALHAFYYTYIDPTQFTPIITAYAFMAVIAGGRGSNRGLLLGAVSVMVLLEGSRFLKDAIPLLDASQIAAIRLILIGLGLILLLIFWPRGFLPEYRLTARPATGAAAER